MVHKHCCYGTCSSDSRKPEEDLYFINFPKPSQDLQKCKKWVHACGRKNFTYKDVNKFTYICCRHFVGNQGPTPLHPDPIGITESVSGRPERKRKWHVGMFNEDRRKKCKSAQNISTARSTVQSTLHEHITDNTNCSVIDSFFETSTNMGVSSIQSTGIQVRENDRGTQTKWHAEDKCSQTCLEVESVYIKKLKNKIANLHNSLTVCALRFESVISDKKKFYFYSGLTPIQFDILWEFLEPSKDNLPLWDTRSKDEHKWTRSTIKRMLSPKNELFVCLLRLRSGFLEQDLAYRFNVSQSYVSRIIITWIQFLYMNFKRLSIFPTREKIKHMRLPKVFRQFKNIRVVIDGFEVTTQKPSDYREQGNMYSSYKAHSTFKFLLGIIPTGGICFVSDAFEGSISDRDIFIKSGFFDKLEPRDSIMVDKGFNVQDLCNEKSVTVFIPPFLKDRQQLTDMEVKLTKRIASARVHVERVVGAIKQFRLLQKILPISLIPIVSQLVFVATSLVNFHEPLVK